MHEKVKDGTACGTRVRRPAFSFQDEGDAGKGVEGESEVGMSYPDAMATLPWAGICAGGGVGGVLNAFLSGNSRLLPSRSPRTWGVGGGPIVRVGLLANLAVGISLPCGLLGLASPDIQTDGALLRLVVLSLLVGFVTARGLTSEVEKRLLRLAVHKAAVAPAAHPDLTQVIDRAPADVIYRMTVELAPRHRLSVPARLGRVPEPAARDGGDAGAPSRRLVN